MKLEGFIGAAYQLTSLNVDAQRCVNLIPEKIESGFGKEAQIAYLFSTPGLNKLLTVGTGPIRCVHVDSIGRIFIVSYNQVYVITESGGTWSATLLGQNGLDGGAARTLDTTTGPVRAASMSFSGTGIDSSTVFVDGTNNYLFFEAAGTTSFGKFLAGGYGSVLTAENIVWSDGFFIVNEGGTNKFFVSDLKDFNIDTLSFSSSEGNPDILLALEVKNRNLYLFNEKTTEIFVNTGNADFPFERASGGFIEVGCAAKYSVAKINDSILWLARQETGQGVVMTMQGLIPQRISTHPIEQAINGYADMSTATAYTYQRDGHAYYVINFAEATWCYDLSTGLWHERAYTNSGTLERHRADTCAFDKGHNYQIVGDYSTNEVYYLDPTTYTDDSDAITRLRSSPHISAGLKRLFCSKFQLDMETGIGLDGGVQGSSPTVMMDFSDDGGHTWSSESWALADAGSGSIGEYKTRVIWRRLGQFRDRIFRVKITDPVKINLISAELEIEVGGS